MSYLNGKTVETLVVPVHCESEQGTAFFISDTQLLTARHVVKAHFQSVAAPAAIYIDVAGQSLLCKGEELSIPGNAIDLALLTVVSEADYHATEYMTLLCDVYVKNMPLRVYGYPQEMAMGCNLVDLEVRNRLEIEGGVWNNRTLIRDDKLALHNFDGLSGSPVVSMSGRVTGIIVLQINETLSYLSVSKAKEHLDNKGICYDTDWATDDITTMGTGRSYQLCKDAVAMVHGRYMPKLHQENRDLEKILENISDKQQLEESAKKAATLSECISKLPDHMKEMIQNKLKIWQDLDIDILMADGCSILKRCYDYIERERPFRSGGYSDKLRKLNEIVYELKEEDFERLNFTETKNLCLIGKAGSGKTHSLCEYALKNQTKTNIYLFFGTDFNAYQSAISYIRDVVCQEMSFVDFNQELKNRGRYAVIVIDAINEGLGCSYGNNHLGALRVELENYDHIRLIISVRIPFDKEVNDLLESKKWHIQIIEGFVNKAKAIDDYFEEYGIDQRYRNHRIEAFKNPLFLKIFCETFHSLTEDERRHVNKQMLYKRYVAKKNEKVTDMVDEDPELNIADKYLSKLANYSVFNDHFNPITRHKARLYGQRMAPYRLWEKDLLHACLTANLLLDDRSHTGEPAVMFEYENLGDYYKAGELLQSKMDVKGLLRWIDDERKYLERNITVPSEKFRTAVKALFDCWYHKGLEVYDERLIQKGGSLYELYYDFLMESDITDQQLISILLRLDNDKVNPLRLVQKFDEVTLDEALQIHEKLKTYPTVGCRDLIWTRYVNRMYEMYGDNYIGEVPLEQDCTLEVSDGEREYLICITWMLSSSHPKFRAIIIRKLRKILQIHQTLILWLIRLFENVNDPYVLGGLYCAVCGVVLPSRDKELTAAIACCIFYLYYEREETVPQDLIVRQWTLKIIERAYYLDEACDYWKRIRTPFKPQPIDESTIPEYHHIAQDYFGLQQGSIRMYHSLFGFEDFNRYIIGTNNRHSSNDYFLPTEDGKYQGVSLHDIMAKMAYYIVKVLGWNDKLGYLDNGKYSPDRSHNDQERIGKKFQWLAWHRMNAHLMDACRTSKDQYYYSDKAEEKDLIPNPYPWNSAEISRFDPTLDVEYKYKPQTGFTGIEIQLIKGKEKENWINMDEYLPDFRYLAKLQGVEYVMLMGYDTSKEKEKEIFLFSNACFVKQEDAEKFANWLKNKNFYGRWMPERRGMIEFLWNDYPWADVYKSSIEHEVWSRPYDCPCNIQLSYEAQLQEDWEGIDEENEFFSTAYMPCVEVMEQMGLYCSEIRGVIKAIDGSVAALNTDHNNYIRGLFVRRDILNDYLKRNGYVMFYYVLGEKLLRIDEMKSIIKELSASYLYRSENEVTVIQPMRVIERELPEVNSTRITALKKKNDEDGLTSNEEAEQAILENEMSDADFLELFKEASEDYDEE